MARGPKSVGLAENREAEGFQQFQKASCSPSQVEKMPHLLDTPLLALAACQAVCWGGMESLGLWSSFRRRNWWLQHTYDMSLMGKLQGWRWHCSSGPERSRKTPAMKLDWELAKPSQRGRWVREGCGEGEDKKTEALKTDRRDFYSTSDKQCHSSKCVYVLCTSFSPSFKWG